MCGRIIRQKFLEEKKVKLKEREKKIDIFFYFVQTKDYILRTGQTMERLSDTSNRLWIYDLEEANHPFSDAPNRRVMPFLTPRIHEGSIV